MLEIPLKIICVIVCIAAPIILWSWVIVPPLMLIVWLFDRKPNAGVEPRRDSDVGPDPLLADSQEDKR